MAGLAASLGLGFVLGVRHAFDPDHVVAIGTLVGKHGRARDGLWAGALWGVGHSATVLVVGLAMSILDLRVTGTMEVGVDLLVALMLVALGVTALRASAAPPSAPEETPTGPAVGAPSVGRLQRWRPVVVGTVHGLAGSAAVSLLAMTTLPTRATAAGYLALFGLGTTLAMALATAALTLPALYLKRAFASSAFVKAAGALSIVWGVGVALSVSFGPLQP